MGRLATWHGKSPVGAHIELVGSSGDDASWMMRLPERVVAMAGPADVMAVLLEGRMKQQLEVTLGKPKPYTARELV